MTDSFEGEKPLPEFITYAELVEMLRILSCVELADTDPFRVAADHPIRVSGEPAVPGRQEEGPADRS